VARRSREASFSFGGVTGGALCACTTHPSLSAWPAVRILGGALLPFIDQRRRRRLGDPHAASASGPTRRILRVLDIRWPPSTPAAQPPPRVVARGRPLSGNREKRTWTGRCTLPYVWYYIYNRASA